MFKCRRELCVFEFTLVPAIEFVHFAVSMRNTHKIFKKIFSILSPIAWSVVVKIPCRQTLTIVSHSNRCVFFWIFKWWTLMHSFTMRASKPVPLNQVIMHKHSQCTGTKKTRTRAHAVRTRIDFTVLAGVRTFCINKCSRSFSIIQNDWNEQKEHSNKWMQSQNKILSFIQHAHTFPFLVCQKRSRTNATFLCRARAYASTEQPNHKFHCLPHSIFAMERDAISMISHGKRSNIVHTCTCIALRTFWAFMKLILESNWNHHYDVWWDTETLVGRERASVERHSSISTNVLK